MSFMMPINAKYKSMALLDLQESLVSVCGDGNTISLRLMLDSGKHPDERNEKGQAGLHLAASHGHETVIKMLLESGADVSATDSYGNTPLHYCGHLETIQCLLDFGANVYALNNSGLTPLKLMKRRGIPDEMLKELEETIEMVKQHSLVDDQLEPLLPQVNLSRNTKPVSTIFREFYDDLGLFKIIITISILMCLSLLIAFVATAGLTNSKSNQKMLINVDNDSLKVEL